MSVIIKLSYREPMLTLIEVPNNKDLGLSLIKANIGTSNGTSWLENVYKCFPDMPEIVITCDESGMLKQLPIVLVTNKGGIAGDVIISEMKRNKEGERDLYGMNHGKASKVLKSLFPDGMNQVNIGQWN